MENIKIEGNFAVKVGNMWAKQDYNEIALKDEPVSLLGFKEAYKMAEKTGGQVVMFKPTELPDEELANLKLAAEIGGEGDEN